MEKTCGERALSGGTGSGARRQGTGVALLAVALVGMGSLVACGGSGGLESDAGTGGGGGTSGQACGAVAACGGAVVGKWNVTDTCAVSVIDLGNICSGITASLALSVSGGVTYNADLTYAQTGTQGGTVRYHFPTACLSGQTCAQLQAALVSPNVATAMGFSFQSATCSAETGGCVCDAVIANVSAAETGTYVTTGGTLSTTHQGTTDDSPYCVNGATMHQMPPAGQGVTGAIILTKQ